MLSGVRPTRAVPELGVQPGTVAPQCVRLGLILLLCQAFPAGSSSYVGIMPLSPPCDAAHPCPACSGMSGIPQPQRARPARMLLSPPALWETAPSKSHISGLIPSSISGGCWTWSRAAGTGREGGSVPGGSGMLCCERCEPKR